MEEEEIKTALLAMESDNNLLTKSAYKANGEQWPGNTISFMDTHLLYIKTHPTLDPSHYLSNLRLMLRKKA